MMMMMLKTIESTNREEFDKEVNHVLTEYPNSVLNSIFTHVVADDIMHNDRIYYIAAIYLK